MGFISRGSDILVRSGGDSTSSSYLYKRMLSDGTFDNVSWGSTQDDFETPIQNTTWSTYGVYKYQTVGMVRQVYSDVQSFNRNIRFDSILRLSNTVTPANTDLSELSYITAVVRGSLTEDTSTLAQRVIDEFDTGVYNYVLAIGTMNRDLDDYRAINYNVDGIKTFSGTAQSTKDYNLPTNEAIYLVNIAIASNQFMENITSLSINIYKQEFIEFLGDNYVTPGSIGKTEMNPDYKAERAINNFIMTIDDNLIVDNTIILSPEYTTQIDNNSIYYMLITGDTTGVNKVSLGYYDVATEAYVSVGTKYDCSISGSVTDKVCVAIITDNEFTIQPIV